MPTVSLRLAPARFPLRHPAPPPPRCLGLGLHEIAAEVLLGSQSVVRATAQREIGRSGWPTGGLGYRRKCTARHPAATPRAARQLESTRAGAGAVVLARAAGLGTARSESSSGAEWVVHSLGRSPGVSSRTGPLMAAMNCCQVGVLGMGRPTGGGPSGSTLAGTSGSGAMSRTRRSTSRLVRCLALAKSSR
jgi:hypothetical protein